MRVKELAENTSVSERSIQRYTKKAYDENLDFIMIGDDRYFFESVVDKEARGKVYEYTLDAKKEEKVQTDITLTIGRNFLLADDDQKAKALLKCRLVEEYIHRDEKVSIHKFLKDLILAYLYSNNFSIFCPV